MSKRKGASAPVSFAAAAPARPNPALWGYGFGAALIGLGLLVLSIALGSALRAATRGVHKFALPASAPVELKEGLYVGLLPAGKGPVPAPEDVDVLITDPDGNRVLRVPFPPEVAQANRKLGTTLFQAQVPFDGRYTLEGRLAPGAPPADLLLVHESLSRNPADIIVGAILMAVLGGFGVYIIVLTSRRRAVPSKPAG